MRRVVVLGGGASGFAAARTLAEALSERPGSRLTVISKGTHCIARPLLAEVAAGWTPPRLAVTELSLLQGRGAVELITDRVVDVDVTSGHVRTEGGQFAFDYLLCAFGRPSRRPAEGSWSDSPHSVYSDRAAIRLRNHLARLASRDEPPTVSIVGGGPVGVDLAATFAEGVAGPQSENGPPPEVQIRLYQRNDRLLPAFPSSFGEHAEVLLEEMGVEVRTATELNDQAPGDQGIVVWAGGLQANAERFAVDEFLRVEGRPNVFAAGACARLADPPKHPLGPGFAVHTGRLAARNLLAAMCGRSPEPMSTAGRMVSVSLGRRRAIAQRDGGEILTGRRAWLLHRMALTRALPDLTAQLGVVGRWAWGLLTGD